MSRLVEIDLSMEGRQEDMLSRTKSFIELQRDVLNLASQASTIVG